MDNLLRSHLRDQLSGQRGRALQAFEDRVTRPMQVRLSRPTRAARQRQWATTLLAMAACVAVGFVLPRFLASPADSGSPAPWPGTGFAGDERLRVPEQLSPFTVEGPTSEMLLRSPIHAAPWKGARTVPQFEAIEPSEPSSGWQSH
ncbi:MAG TPA: hypothetical protein VF624_12735 [Tepidisphaeraceae bacterium]